jgi:hypothetical protein
MDGETESPQEPQHVEIEHLEVQSFAPEAETPPAVVVVEQPDLLAAHLAAHPHLSMEDVWTAMETRESLEAERDRAILEAETARAELEALRSSSISSPPPASTETPPADSSTAPDASSAPSNPEPIASQAEAGASEEPSGAESLAVAVQAAPAEPRAPRKPAKESRFRRSLGRLRAR